MSACGIPEHEMVVIITNPKTKKPISPVTLRKHFRAELDRGILTTNMKVMAGLFKNATTATAANPGGNPILQMFWAKTRLHWRDNVPMGADLPPPGDAEDADEIKINYEIARRIAYALDVTPPRQIAKK